MIGYGHAVASPFGIAVERPGEPVAPRATADHRACSDVWVSLTLDLALDLPAAPAQLDPAVATVVSRARGAVPIDLAMADIAVTGVASEGGGLRVAFAGGWALRSADLLIEDGEGEHFFGAPDWRRTAEGWPAKVLLAAASRTSGCAFSPTSACRAVPSSEAAPRVAERSGGPATLHAKLVLDRKQIATASRIPERCGQRHVRTCMPQNDVTAAGRSGPQRKSALGRPEAQS